MTILTFSPAEVESLRRSAAMAPLPPNDVVAALEDLRQLHHERVKVRDLIVRLRPPWEGTRVTLNELATVLAERQ